MDPNYSEQLDLQKYAENQRKLIHRWISSKFIQLITLSEAIEKLKQQDYYEIQSKVYAVLDPIIVGSLSYDPVRMVSSIKPITPERKAWLIDYWLQKYEIDISESEASQWNPWNYEVGLIFENYSYYYESVNLSIYGYPSCLIATFLFKRD